MKKLNIPSNLTSLAYESIKEAILTGALDENSRLTEDFLSNRLGISKSPVREALTRLETEGLIRIEPRRGTYLRRLTVKEVSDLYDLREALELHAMRTAKISPELVAELRGSVARMRERIDADDKTGFADEDLRFHASLARATGNQQLCEALEKNQNLIWLVRRTTYNLAGSAAPDYHERIAECLANDDRDGAERIMRDHIRNVGQRLVAFLDAQPAATSDTEGVEVKALAS